MHAPRFTPVIAFGGVLIAAVAAAGQARADTLVRHHTDPSKSDYSIHLHVDNPGQCSQYAHQSAFIGNNFWAFDARSRPGTANCYIFKSSIPEVKHWPRGTYDVYAL